MLDFLEPLPTTLEPSPAIEVAEKFDTIIAYATPESLSNSLPATGFKVRSADDIVNDGTPGFEKVKDTYNVISTEADPAVIVLYGASFCSLMLAKDLKGNAVGIHRPIDFEDGIFSSMKYAVNKVKDFFSGIKQVIGDNDGFLILSGVNPLSFGDKSQLHLEALVEKQNKHTRLSILKLFVKPNESSLNRNALKVRPVRNLRDEFAAASRKGKAFPGNIRNINGLIFVPRQITNDGKDRIFVMDWNSDSRRIKDVLFPQVAVIVS